MVALQLFHTPLSHPVLHLHKTEVYFSVLHLHETLLYRYTKQSCITTHSLLHLHRTMFKPTSHSYAHPQHTQLYTYTTLFLTPKPKSFLNKYNRLCSKPTHTCCITTSHSVVNLRLISLCADSTPCCTPPSHSVLHLARSLFYT